LSNLEEQQARILIHGVKDYAILMLDRQGLVASWTPCAERIKGYCAEEIVGKSFACFYLPGDTERGHPEEVLRIAAEEGHFEEDGWRVRKDGSHFWASVMITALRGRVDSSVKMSDGHWKRFGQGGEFTGAGTDVIAAACHFPGCLISLTIFSDLARNLRGLRHAGALTSKIT